MLKVWNNADPNTVSKNEETFLRLYEFWIIQGLQECIPYVNETSWYIAWDALLLNKPQNGNECNCLPFSFYIDTLAAETRLNLSEK